MHSSLLRILTPEQLSKSTISAINQTCQQWTTKLRGTQLKLPEAWCVPQPPLVACRHTICAVAIFSPENELLEELILQVQI